MNFIRKHKVIGLSLSAHLPEEERVDMKRRLRVSKMHTHGPSRSILDISSKCRQMQVRPARVPVPSSMLMWYSVPWTAWAKS